ncbi:MAG TPA: repressor LexA [Eubacteriaceae bacterium]|nr:repressor LexA [Eubacteriaceae bacterium]
MYDDLSDKQQKILSFIMDEVKKKGYPPSVREIGLAVGLKSTSTVHGHLSRLEKKGYLRRDPSLPRAIEVLSNLDLDEKVPVHEIANVPIVGTVTAGAPILAVENIEDTFPLPVEFVGNQESFILSVTGDSMIEAGILSGDYVIVRRQSTAQNGDIVVALVEGEAATVKRFFKESDHYRLQPENQAMEPILSKDVTILGKVSGLIRKL